MKQPKYARVAEAIRGDIRRGRYGPGARLPGHLALARQYGVSAITSNRALAELAREGLIVRRERSGSFVNARAGRLDHVVVVLRGAVHDEDDMSVEHWRGIVEAAAQAGVAVRTVHPSDARFAEAVAGAGHPGRGAILVMCTLPETLAQRLAQRDVPQVMLGMEDEASRYCVLADRRRAASALARTLVADGCRRIGFVGTLAARNHRLARDGYLAATACLGHGSRYVRDVAHTTVAEAVRKLLHPRRGLDGLIVMGSRLPVAALPVVLGLGRPVKLGVLTENSAVMQLNHVAYVGWYSQSEAGRLAFQLLQEVAAGRTLAGTTLYPPFRILRPASPRG